ncbi:hypothetical protein MCUN1_003619 [Malassezia cuniculi]|uniref:Uncharacterized protein n=1 Tax=Malassezia cuniculi TaxID=948313 RepID=A0AAF0J7K8_9BASI|nr:hypothetical protein MCUN1_003619 [Malassezia cuniculi]
MLSRVSRSAFRLSARIPCAAPRPAVAMRTFSATALSAALFNVQGADKRPGSIIREAAPGIQKQPYTLVFVSQGDRKSWQPWIGYFTTAGYDCIDLSLEGSENLAEDLTGQVRVASLQREPVIFVMGPTDEIFGAYLGSGGWFARRGPASGAVLIHPSTQASQEAAWPKRMPVIVVPRNESEISAWEQVLKDKTGRIIPDAKPDTLLKEIERVLRESKL